MLAHLVAVVCVLPGGAIDQGLQAYLVAFLLVLEVHGAARLEGGSVSGDKGGIPVSTN